MQAGLSFAMLEAGLRGAAVALDVVLAALLLRDSRRSPAGLYGALFALSAAAYVVVTAPGLLYQPALPWLVPLRLISLGTPAVFWLFAVAAFDDAAVASWRDALPWLGTVALGFVCASGLLPAACPLYHALQLVFVGLAIRQALVGRARRSRRGAPPLPRRARARRGALHGRGHRAGALHGRPAGRAAGEHR